MCSSDGEFETPGEMLQSSYLGSLSLDHSVKCMGKKIF
jgi:hypothetical protein